ncbi:hypothetical protein C480_10140 [Natrialba aegyptia DSM 13077]|uniref:Uncharacterized protein n=2 Tax=Natrialba aegyptia TaxID=129789 RepID=M0B7X4_9EURY|nr:hypothetical protein C480_10140 [Natrialba aegyptia DSM 13077]
MILESEGTDWKFFDSPQTYVYSPDPRLRIEKCGDCESGRDYQHTWTNRYNHSEDTEVLTFRVYFNESLIDQLQVLRIDEFRCKMPMPRTKPDLIDGLESREDYNEVSISRYQEGIARAMTDDWDHYRNVGDITVRDEDGI